VAAARRSDLSILVNELANRSDTRALDRRLMAIRPAHFNATLKQANQFFDRYDQAVRAVTIQERERLTAEVDADVARYAAANAGRFGDASRQVFSLMVGPFGHFVILHDVHQVCASLQGVDLCLWQYHADHGSFPGNLDALIPQYLPTLPPDPYGDKLRYQKTADGFLLYSVGPNQKDDGGKKGEKAEDGDIVIQFP
jgi:hypothetical protein